jgi:hypothetical protein
LAPGHCEQMRSAKSPDHSWHGSTARQFDTVYNRPPTSSSFLPPLGVKTTSAPKNLIPAMHIRLLRRIPDYPPPPHPSKSSASAVHTYILSFPSHPLLRSQPIHRSISTTATISVMHGALHRDGRCAASQRGPAIYLKCEHVRGFGTRPCAGSSTSLQSGGEPRQS